MTKYLLLVLFLLSSSVITRDASAQKSKAKVAIQAQAPVKRLDTLTIGGLRPGDQMAAFKRVSFDLDTVFWQGNTGANMLKGIVTQFGQKGECRISTRDGEIQQVAFNMSFADSNKAIAAFKQLERDISTAYGLPDEEYHNVHRSIKWKGDKRILSLKGMEGTSTLSIVLTSVPKPEAKPGLRR
jgi:hypothetical protein